LAALVPLDRLSLRAFAFSCFRAKRGASQRSRLAPRRARRSTGRRRCRPAVAPERLSGLLVVVALVAAVLLRLLGGHPDALRWRLHPVNDPGILGVTVIDPTILG